jgi:hypothetical protein
MFRLDGQSSQVSSIVHSLLRNSKLFSPGSDGSPSPLTCVVYREDPVHRYLFATALAGLTQEEPMFGPVVEGDQRQRQIEEQERIVVCDPDQQRASGEGGKSTGNFLGFSRREGIAWYRTPFLGKHWQLWLSGRKARARKPSEASARQNDDFKGALQEFKQELFPALQTFLNATAPKKALFPKLWYYERRVRDQLHEEFRH